MQTHKTHFEQIPVAVVKQIIEKLPPEEKPAAEDWRDIAQRAQTEPDGGKLIELIQQLIEKFDEEKLRQGRAAYRARDRSAR